MAAIRRPRPVLGGAVVVAVGAAFFLQAIPATAPYVGSLLFVFLGLAFAIAYGIGTRPFAYLLPAGVLLGFGVGLLLPSLVALPAVAAAPIFLFSLGLGLVVVYLLEPRHRWPLVPAAIVAAISLVGALAPELIPDLARPYIIPAILVGVGAYLLVETGGPPARRS